MLKMHIPVIQQHKQDLVKDDTFDSGFTSTWGSQWKQVSLVGNLTQSHYVCSCEYVRMHVHCAAADISWDLWGWQRRAEVENNFQLLQGLNQTHTQTQLSRGRKNKQEAQVVLYVKAADDLCSSFDSGVVNDRSATALHKEISQQILRAWSKITYFSIFLSSNICNFQQQWGSLQDNGLVSQQRRDTNTSRGLCKEWDFVKYLSKVLYYDNKDNRNRNKIHRSHITVQVIP